MKFKNLSILVLLAALTFSFAACGSDEDEDNKNEKNENDENDDTNKPTQEFYYLPIEMKTEDVNEYYEFEYDANRRMVKFVQTSGDNLTATIEYDSNGNATKFVEDYTSRNGSFFKTTMELRYNNDSIFILFSDSRPSDTIIAQSNGLILKKLNGYNDGTSFYHDNKDRIIKVIDSNNKATNYSYDSKKGIFKDMKTPQWLFYILSYDNTISFYNLNNILSEIEYSKDNILVSDETFVYEYNEEGYPTKVKGDFQDKKDPSNNSNSTASISYKKIAK